MFGISKSNNNVDNGEKNIFFHEDYSDKDVSEALVGRKGKSLFALRDMDVPIPGFFVVSPIIYKRFLLTAFDNKLVELLEKVKTPDSIELEKLIMKAEFDSQFVEELHRAYSRLSGFADAWVAVRSSVVFPSREDISFSGLFGTELNVKGFNHLLEAIKHIYVSVFKNRVIVYGRENGLDLTNLQMSVVIQKMVQPEVSGVAYTLDPVTSDDKKMSIEAVFGLGDVIADGSITPDQYILNKRNLEITEKQISPQEWMKIRKPGSSTPGTYEETQKIQISKAWSHQQKLEDNNIREVAKVALIVEDRAKKLQSVEWIWESGNVWILQSKTIPSVSQLGNTSIKVDNGISTNRQESVFDIAIDIVKEEKLKDSSLKVNTLHEEQSGVVSDERAMRKEIRQSDKDVNKLSRFSERLQKLSWRKNIADDRAKIRLQEEQDQKLSELGIGKASSNYKMEFLLTGIGSSFGEVTGFVKVLNSPIPDSLTVTKESVLLIKKFSTDMEKLIIEAGAVLMDDGGLTSDISIFCREHNIPAVVGTGLASALLKDGDIVKIDGNIGSVYRVNQVEKEKDSKPVSDAVELERENESSIINAAERARNTAMRKVIESNSKPEITSKVNVKEYDPQLNEKIITATKVMVMPEDGAAVDRYNSIITLVDGVCFIDLDRLMLMDKRHPLAYVEDKNFKQYSKNLEKFLDRYTDAVGGNEVIVTLGSAPLGQFRALVKGSTMENKELSESLYGAQRYLSNKPLLEKALSIVKKVRNLYKSRNLSLAIHSPMSGDVMREIKKEISSLGLKRTGTFNIYAVIDNPAEVILAEEILDAGIDGLIINTPRIARIMQGLPLYGENVKYDIGVSSVHKVVQSCIKESRGKRGKIIVVADSNDALIKRCIEWGAYGIAVTPDFFNEAKKLVSKEETKMIMGINVISY